jgi:hypothetical protein
MTGEIHDQADAKWIVIRGPSRGRNDTPCGRPTPGRPIGCPGVGCPYGEFGILSYCKLVLLIFDIVRLIVEFTDAPPNMAPQFRVATDAFTGWLITSADECHGQEDHANK